MATRQNKSLVYQLIIMKHTVAPPYITIIVDGCMEEDKSKKCNQHQGRQFLSEPFLFLILTLIFMFTPDIYRCIAIN